MSDVECIEERDPAEGELSEVSDDDLLTPEERVLLYRELQEVEEGEPESALGNGQNRASGSNLEPEGPPDLPRAITLEPRDRNGSCHPLLCGKEGARRCFVEEFMAIKKVRKFMFKDQSTCTSWDALDGSDVDEVLEDEKEELLEKYNKGLEEEKKDLLTRYQELLKRNAEMEKKVNEKEERNMELRTQLEKTVNARKLGEAKYEELNERWKDSGNGSTSTEEGDSKETDDDMDPVLPALLSPSDGEENHDNDSISDANQIDEEVIGYLRNQGEPIDP